MKKIIIISLITIGGATFYFFNQADSSKVAIKVQSKKPSESRIKAKKILEQRVKRREAKKEQVQEVQRTLTNEETRIIDLTTKGLGLSDINEQMLATYKQLAPKNSKLHDFIKNFSFEDEYKRELAKLDNESLRIIGELEDHPTSQELTNNTKETNIKIEEFMATGKGEDISPEKQNLIDLVTTETSAHESMLELTQNILESSIRYGLTNTESNLNQSEVELQSIERADSYIQKQAATFKKIVDISYSSLSANQLEEYSDFLQKINAREATVIATKALEPVFYRFTIGIIDRTKKP
jgi:hypothetical protein